MRLSRTPLRVANTDLHARPDRLSCLSCPSCLCAQFVTRIERTSFASPAGPAAMLTEYSPEANPASGRSIATNGLEPLACSTESCLIVCFAGLTSVAETAGAFVLAEYAG